MSSSNRVHLVRAVAVGLAAILLYLALRDVDWGELGAILAGARPEYLALAGLTIVGSISARAIRWCGMLSIARKVPLAQAFWATAVGYFGNAYLPARAGDVLRSLLIGQRIGSGSFALGATFAERVLEALLMTGFGALLLPLFSGMPAWMERSALGVLAASVSVLVMLVILARFKQWLAEVSAGWTWLGPWRERFFALLDQFLSGARAVRSPRGLTRFLSLSVLAWCFDVASLILVATALGLPLALPHALVLLLALAVATAVPSTPGYVGVYQFVAVTVLGPFGFSPSQALAHILVVQAATYAVVTTLGLIGLWRLGAGLASLRGELARSGAPAELG